MVWFFPIHVEENIMQWTIVEEKSCNNEKSNKLFGRDYYYQMIWLFAFRKKILAKAKIVKSVYSKKPDSIEVNKQFGIFD